MSSDDNLPFMFFIAGLSHGQATEISEWIASLSYYYFYYYLNKHLISNTFCNVNLLNVYFSKALISLGKFMI